MNVGCCSYPRFVWKAEKESLPAWSNVFGGTSYRESEKLLRAFLKKYRLVKMPDKRSHRQSGGGVESLYRTPGGAVLVRCGRYLSHRRGYAPNYVEVRLDDFTDNVLRFRFRGTIDEARVLFAGREFKNELDDNHPRQGARIPAATATGLRFARPYMPITRRSAAGRTSNVPTLGPGRAGAHAADRLQGCGQRRKRFWQTRDLARLAKEIGAGDAMNAGWPGFSRMYRGDQRPEPSNSAAGPVQLRARSKTPWLKVDCLAGHSAKLRTALVLQAMSD